MAARTAVKLVLPSDVRLVELAHAVTERIGEAAGLDAGAALDLGLAVREAVINAIVHGNRKDPSQEVELTFATGGRGIRIRVLDRGTGFDPESLPDPTAPENVLRNSGRGLLLMRSFVDDVRFRYREGRGMEITLIKSLGSPRRTVGAAGDRPERLVRRTRA